MALRVHSNDFIIGEYYAENICFFWPGAVGVSGVDPGYGGGGVAAEYALTTVCCLPQVRAVLFTILVGEKCGVYATHQATPPPGPDPRLDRILTITMKGNI